MDQKADDTDLAEFFQIQDNVQYDFAAVPSNTSRSPQLETPESLDSTQDSLSHGPHGPHGPQGCDSFEMSDSFALYDVGTKST